MVKLYVRKIKEGTFELERVPAYWYEEVKAVLIADGFLKEETKEEVSEAETEEKVKEEATAKTTKSKK